LALASIVLHAIVLATHLHPDLLSAGASTAVFAGTPGEHERRQLPAPAKPGADDCAICFALHLAAASPVPEAPALPISHSNEIVFASSGDSLDLATLPYLHFRTRAPPVVEVDQASV
jgi:hypothetical protein